MRLFLQLTKAKISVMVVVTTATGYVLAADPLTLHIVLPLLGTLLLALGASALNQYQEREIDALMRRTRQRPIPSGRITPGGALRVSVGLLVAGLAILASTSGLTAAGLGLLAVVWYNGFYTHLKRISRFAAVPGAAIGAIPPAMGWAAAGGDLAAVEIWALMAFLFVWQVPHFWMLLLLNPADYDRARLPDLGRLFSPAQLSRVTFVWILATAATCLLFPLFGLMRVLPIYLLMLAGAAWMSARAFRLVRQRPVDRRALRVVAITVNSFMLVALVNLIMDHALRG